MAYMNASYYGYHGYGDYAFNLQLLESFVGKRLEGVQFVGMFHWSTIICRVFFDSTKNNIVKMTGKKQL